MYTAKKLGGPSRWKANSVCLTKTGFLIILITTGVALLLTRNLTYSVVSAAGCCICMDLVMPAILFLLKWKSLDAGLALSVLEHIVVSLLLRLLFAALQALIGVVIFVPLLMYLLLQLILIAICTAVRLCAKIGSVASTKSWEVLQPLCLWGQQILLLKTLEDCVQGQEVIFPLPNKWIAISVMVVMLWSKFERKFPTLTNSDNKMTRNFVNYILHPTHNLVLLLLALPANLNPMYIMVAMLYVVFTERFFQEWIVSFLEDHSQFLVKYIYYFIPHIARKVWIGIENMPGFEELYVRVGYEIATACTAGGIIIFSAFLNNYESFVVLVVVFLTNVAIPMGTAQGLIRQLKIEMAQIDHLQKATPYQLARVHDICSICWLPMDMAVITKCSHFFHAKCLKQWIVIKETCPLCNRDIHV
ncbi:uncharacterized protein [Ptychodera flava]|uniref:uncharacterized protein isoform X2 n=1 Tax=Ptychodera flava TaxID=63121 RepID=UPI00396A9F72